jgi:hypothetical protein
MSFLRGQELASHAGRHAHEDDVSRSCAQVQVEALAADLKGRGFATRVSPEENPPSVTVESLSSALSATVHAAPREDGSWWFWWSRDEPISRISEVEAAAFKIAYVLTLQPDHTDDLRPTVPGQRRRPGRRTDGCPWVDQVVRRHRFEAAHPEVTITFTPQGWTWTGTCAVGGRDVVLTGHELSDLLDGLEGLLGDQEQAQ